MHKRELTTKRRIVVSACECVVSRKCMQHATLTRTDSTGAKWKKTRAGENSCTVHSGAHFLLTLFILSPGCQKFPARNIRASYAGWLQNEKPACVIRCRIFNSTRRRDFSLLFSQWSFPSRKNIRPPRPFSFSVGKFNSLSWIETQLNNTKAINKIEMIAREVYSCAFNHATRSFKINIFRVKIY